MKLAFEKQPKNSRRADEGVTDSSFEQKPASSNDTSIADLITNARQDSLPRTVLESTESQKGHVDVLGFLTPENIQAFQPFPVWLNSQDSSSNPNAWSLKRLEFAKRVAPNTHVENYIETIISDKTITVRLSDNQEQVLDIAKLNELFQEKLFNAPVNTERFYKNEKSLLQHYKKRTYQRELAEVSKSYIEWFDVKCQSVEDYMKNALALLERNDGHVFRYITVDPNPRVNQRSNKPYVIKLNVYDPETQERVVASMKDGQIMLNTYYVQDDTERKGQAMTSREVIRSQVNNYRGFLRSNYGKIFQTLNLKLLEPENSAS